MKLNIGKSDAELKADVLSELKAEPRVKITDIGVLVKEGTVTLNGYASSYGEKFAAVQSAKRVAGVKAIADDIQIKLPDSSHRTDGDIANAAANQINWTAMIPKGTTEVTVREGWITLEGEVEWWYEKNAAENAVHHLTGVKGVTNLIKIKPKPASEDIESIMKNSFERNALLEARNIQVETSENKVVLRGRVQNYTEREEAERIAWSTPGVLSVDNQLDVEWFWGEE